MKNNKLTMAIFMIIALFVTANAALAAVPISADNTVTAIEDTTYVFQEADFPFTDAVDADTLASVKITDLEDVGALKLNGADVILDQVITVADIQASLLTFDTAAQDENGVGYDNFQFTVTDSNAEESTPANTITIDVTADNDVPVISDITNQTAVEDGEFSLSLTVTDVDNTQEELSIDAAKSTLEWLTVDADDSLKLTGTPTNAEIGEKTITVIVTDGSGDSEEKTFLLTVKPSIEILEDTIKVYVNNVETSLDSLDVNVNDQIKVKFDYQNNLPENVIYAQPSVKAYNDADPNLDFVQFEETLFDLLPGLGKKSTEFTFTVPASVIGSQFTVTIELSANDDQETVHSDSHTIDFALSNKKKSVQITSASLQDDELTCTKTTDLDLTLKNTGDEPFAPQVRVFSEAATLNTVTGVLTSTGVTLATFPEDSGVAAATMNSAEELTYNVPVNASELSGAQTVYVYVVSPWFKTDPVSGSFYIGAETTVDLKNSGDCLNQSNLETALTFTKNANADLVIDLFDKDAVTGEYIYINEDDDYEASLTFSIPTDTEEETFQTNSDLTSCTVAADGKTLTCSKPATDADGTSDVTVNVNEATSNSDFNEQLTVTVSETLQFTSVSVNSQSINVNQANTETSLTAKPLTEISVDYSLKNSLNQKVTDIAVTVTGIDGMVFEEDSFYLGADQQTSGTVKGIIPLNTASGTYDLTLQVTGKGEEDNSNQEDKVSFKVEVAPQGADLVITTELADAETMSSLTCNNDVILNVDYINLGTTDEDDLVITVKDDSKVVWNSQVDSVNVNAEGFLVLKNNADPANTGSETIPLKISGKGTHTLSATLEFNFDNNGIAGTTVVAAPVTTTKNNCIQAVEPTDTNLAIADDASQLFKVDVEDGFVGNVQWFVIGGNAADDDNLQGTGEEFTFTPTEVAQFTVKAVLDSDSEDYTEWAVTVTDKPTDLDQFGFTSEEITAIADINLVQDLVLENTNGKIEFSQPIDLSEVLVLADVVKLDSQLVGIDSTNAADLNKEATITLNNVAAGKTAILKYPGFGNNLGEASLCGDACATISHVNGKFIFSVTGFSTYQVVLEQEVDLETPNEILFTDVDLETDAETTFDIKNLGTIDTMNNIAFDLTEIDSEYEATIESAPTSLDAAETAQVTLKLKVQEEEEAGKNKIGDLKISWEDAEGVSESTTVPVYLTPKSYLTIDRIKINGKTSGELSLDEINEIEVKVENDYTEDMEDVEVTVKILDVDGDDLEEESEEFDIDEGDSEDDFEVEFDLSGEDIDEEKYTLEITVEGEATDGSEHKTVETKEVELDLEKHKVIIRTAILTSETVHCLDQTTLEVKVENIGKSNEDEVEIKVSSSELSLSQSKVDLELDKFSGIDNDYRTTFSVDVSSVNAGTYPISVEVYRDEDKLEDSKTVNLVVEDCLVTSTSTQTQNTLSTSDVQQQLLAQQLQQQLEARQTESATVQASFRESSSYFVLLAILAMLLFIALILMVAVLVVKKPKVEKK